MTHQRTVDEGKVKRPKPATEERINEHLADSQRDPSGLIDLQKTVGNRAVQLLLAQRSGDSSFELDDETTSRIYQDRGGGQPLEGRVQQQAGEAMGQDFSGVRVHDSSEANDLSQELNAKAFTTGQDIFFREGAYEPNSSNGQELIAHELAHVVQQGSGAVSDGGRGMTVNPPGDAFEQEADTVAKAVTNPGNAPGVQRQDVPEEEEIQAQVEEDEELQMQKDDDEEKAKAEGEEKEEEIFDLDGCVIEGDSGQIPFNYLLESGFNRKNLEEEMKK